MIRFRRVCAAAALLTLLLAAVPAPASAAPWTTGFEDVGARVQWRVMTWVIKHLTPSRGITNATAQDGGRVVP